MYHARFHGRIAQRAQDDRALLAHPTVLLRIIEPHALGELPEKIRVEVAHRLHLVIRHGQRREDGRGRPQEAAQDSQLALGPGGLDEAEDAQGSVPDEQGKTRQHAGPRRAKDRLKQTPGEGSKNRLVSAAGSRNETRRRHAYREHPAVRGQTDVGHRGEEEERPDARAQRGCAGL